MSASVGAMSPRNREVAKKQPRRPVLVRSVFRFQKAVMVHRVLWVAWDLVRKRYLVMSVPFLSSGLRSLMALVPVFPALALLRHRSSGLQDKRSAKR